MNVCIRRLIHRNLISHVKVPTLKRGMLTCYTQGGVKSRLVPYVAPQNTQIGFMDVSVAFNDLSIKNGFVRSTITDPILVPKGEIGIPISVIIHDFELPTLSNGEMMDPAENVIEKKAHRMMRIRKKKMKRHKWKKLQKKMRFVFAKIRRKRKAKKEAIFKEELRQIVKAGEEYNPEQELKEKLRILNAEIPINRVRGFFSPKWVVDEYLTEQKKKKMLDNRVNICLKKMK